MMAGSPPPKEDNSEDATISARSCNTDRSSETTGLHNVDGGTSENEADKELVLTSSQIDNEMTANNEDTSDDVVSGANSASKTAPDQEEEGDEVEDEDLEEGELKDDDDDDDDEAPSPPSSFNHQHHHPALGQGHGSQMVGHNNNNNNSNSSNNNNNNNNNNIYSRGGPGTGGPMHKVNIRCRFYSKTSNKCTWGDHCRFEHRDDSPGPEFDRPPGGPGPGGPSSSRGPPIAMGPAERGQYPPPYAGWHQPYPRPPAPHGYMPPYDAYPPHHPHQPYPPPPPPHGYMPYSAYPHHPPHHHSTPPPIAGGVGPGGGSPSSSSLSAVVYERKQRLAFEVAPWNDNPPGSRGFYKNHYPRDQPSGRDLSPHMGGGPQYPGYPSYPSTYRTGPMGPHGSASHHNKFMSSSQRSAPPDSRRSRSNKRGHDEDESSWSDSGSEDSILAQPNYGGTANSMHPSNLHKKQNTDTTTSDEQIEQGSGTPPGEPLPEDVQRQEMLLNKLKEIEDLMAKKKGEQED